MCSRHTCTAYTSDGWRGTVRTGAVISPAACRRTQQSAGPECSDLTSHPELIDWSQVTRRIVRPQVWRPMRRFQQERVDRVRSCEDRSSAVTPDIGEFA